METVLEGTLDRAEGCTVALGAGGHTVAYSLSPACPLLRTVRLRMRRCTDRRRAPCAHSAFSRRRFVQSSRLRCLRRRPPRRVPPSGRSSAFSRPPQQRSTRRVRHEWPRWLGCGTGPVWLPALGALAVRHGCIARSRLAVARGRGCRPRPAAHTPHVAWLRSVCLRWSFTVGASRRARHAAAPMRAAAQRHTHAALRCGALSVRLCAADRAQPLAELRRVAAAQAVRIAQLEAELRRRDAAQPGASHAACCVLRVACCALHNARNVLHAVQPGALHAVCTGRVLHMRAVWGTLAPARMRCIACCSA